MSKLTRTELLEKIETEHRRLEQNIAALSPEQLVQAGVVGEWSVKDILTHLSVWERRLLQRIQHQPERGSDMGTHEFNAMIYLEHKDRSWAEVRAEFIISYRAVLEAIHAFDEAELEVWRMSFAWNTHGHYRWAKTRIRQWKASLE
jgi:hypothetical protein